MWRNVKSIFRSERSKGIKMLLKNFRALDLQMEADFPSKCGVDFLPEERNILESSRVVGSKGQKALLRRGYSVDTNSLIAEGGFGLIFEAEVPDGQMGAVKVFDVNDLLSHQREIFLKDFPRELVIIKRLDHPHIVTTFHIFLQLGSGRVYVFMERADTDLSHYMKPVSSSDYPTERQIKSMFRQMAAGLNYMHSHDWCHRDIKTLNCLVFTTAPEPVLKWTDFGFARSVTDPVSEEQALSENYNAATLQYRAPEIYMTVPYLPLPTDVWSLGVCLFFLLNKAYPFNYDAKAFKPTNRRGQAPDLDRNIEAQQTKKYKWNRKYAHLHSPQAKDLVDGMMEPVLDLRLTMPQVLAHDWLRDRLSHVQSLSFMARSKLSLDGL